MEVILSDELLRDQIQIFSRFFIRNVNVRNAPDDHVFRDQNVIGQKDLVLSDREDGIEQNVYLCVNTVAGLIDAHVFKRGNEITAHRGKKCDINAYFRTGIRHQSRARKGACGDHRSLPPKGVQGVFTPES